MEVECLLDIAMLNNVVREAETVLGMPKDLIFKESLKGFLMAKIEENDKLIQSLAEKYGVTGYLVLEERIKKGEISGHPAWEDVILWEQLFKHNIKLHNIVQEIKMGDDVGLS